MQPNSAVCPFELLPRANALKDNALAVCSLANGQTAQQDSLRQMLMSLIGERQFDHWFRGKTRLAVEAEALVVYSANPFLQKWLQKQHRAALAEVARSVIGISACVRFDVDANLVAPAKSASNADSAIAEMP